jgi:cytochrome c peroxidase
MGRTATFLTALFLGAGAACGPRVGSTPPQPYLATLPMGARAKLPVPADNPLTSSRVALGRRLFFEQRLSRDGSVACASCHAPNRAFTDGRERPLGVGGVPGRRNAPTLVNRAYGRSFFWDGRAASLEEQALQPMVSPREMGNTHQEIVRRLARDPGYRRDFQRAFGIAGVTIERVAQAIAAFERTLVAGNSAFDRFATLGDPTALSPEARRGLELFGGKARCTVCHEPPLFTDERFHNTGVAWRSAPPSDSGRYAVTVQTEDIGAFKTPTLREVALTAPYMHDGSVATLEEVVDFYDRGGVANPYLDPLVQPLQLTREEKRALLAFLRSLGSPNLDPAREQPGGPR